MLSDYNEEQFDVEREHHPYASLLKRFVEWKNLKLKVELDLRNATVWFSSDNGENLCVESEDPFTDLMPFLHYFHSISDNENEAKKELLMSEFLCGELLYSMAGKHFLMFKNDYSNEYIHDFTFPDSWQILEMQMTVAGF